MGAAMMYWRIVAPIAVAVYVMFSWFWTFEDYPKPNLAFVWWHPAISMFVAAVAVMGFGVASWLQRERDRNAIGRAYLELTDEEKDVITALRKRGS